MDVERREVIKANLAAVRGSIADSCIRHGRDVNEVTLIAVTKTFPVADVVHLAALGVTDVGENKDQEASAKHDEYIQLEPRRPLRWHLVGQLQRNKAKSVARYADMVHSVDRPALAEALEKACQSLGRTLSVLIQVDLDAGRDEARGGVHPEDLMALAEYVSAYSALRLEGLMAVAPLDQEPATAFERLAAIRARFAQSFPDASVLSAGMSQDLDAAIAHGATHVRIGSALLGSRPLVG